MNHFKLTMNATLFFENCESFSKSILMCGRQEIAKPFTNNFFTVISKVIKPLLIYFNEISIKIKGLITEWCFVKQKLESFFACPQFLAHLFSFRSFLRKRCC